jgi:hypothetical protein
VTCKTPETREPQVGQHSPDFWRDHLSDGIQEWPEGGHMRLKDGGDGPIFSHKGLSAPSGDMVAIVPVWEITTSTGLDQRPGGSPCGLRVSHHRDAPPRFSQLCGDMPAATTDQPDTLHTNAPYMCGPHPR